MKTINKTGLNEIAEFIKAHHKNGERIAENIGYLNALADEAEITQDYVHVELPSFATWRGETVVLEISKAGIDDMPECDD